MTRTSRQGAIPSDIGKLIDDLNEFERRLSLLEAPSGEALGSTIAKLSALVADIQAELDAWAAGRWTNGQIVSQISSQISSTLAGNVTIGGQFRAPDAVAFNITGTRRTAWLEDATGRLGYAPSTERVKRSIRPADADRLLRILDAVPVTFLYGPEILRRVNLRATYGKDYMPPRELGLIAEELDALGFWEFVIYGDDGRPEGIEYSMLVVALLSVARTQRDDIAEIKAHLGLGS